jgi:hypothetical protein
MKEYYILIPILILLNVINYYFTLEYLTIKVLSHENDGFIIVLTIIILISSLILTINYLIKKKYLSSITLLLIFISSIYWFIEFSKLKCSCIEA